MTVKKFFNIPPSLKIRYGIPLWGTLGTIIILVLGVIFIMTLSLNHSQDVMIQVLSEKGAALISGIEGSVRTSKESHSGIRLQLLLEEIAKRQDVMFIVVTTQHGVILTYNDSIMSGRAIYPFEEKELLHMALTMLIPEDDYAWRMISIEGKKSFVVYKAFHPKDEGLSEKIEVPSFIFLGLDPEPLIFAQAQDKEQSLVLGGGVLLVGIVALLSLHVFGYIKSFRQRQKVAEALADELAMTLPDGLIIFDFQGHIIRMNMASASLLGITDGIDDGWKIYDGENTNEVLPESLMALVAKLVDEGELEETEVVISTTNDPYYVSIRGGHIGLHKEERMGYLLFLRDITAVRKLEAEVRRREKLSAVGTLAAGVAHELRNPLSSIKGYASYFGERFSEGSDDKEAARVMVQEVERLNRAISDLIGLSLPTDIHPIYTDLRQVIQDILRLIEQDACGHSVLVKFESESDLPLAYIDPDRIRQVLLNLCLNALEAMPDGGILKFSLHFDAYEQQLFLEVKDTGIGIHETSLSQIFDPYFTTKTRGTGLGLATVYKIMEAHKGTITVSSELNKGTVFRLMFPLH